MDDDTTTPPEGDEAKNDALGDAGKRALDAERKARRIAEKRAADAEAKIKEAEEADKTELERLQGHLSTITKERDAAQAMAARFEVAAAKGLSLAQARRLVGATKEELEEDAEQMRAELGLNKESETKADDEKSATTSERPKEDLKAGASNTEDEAPDAGKLAEQILGSF